ncbi:hypothetical protein BDV29DRAFT_166027 [Aspergillus leporis]|uniref:Uncharacterized protein n=1 Tax=Aspergillus leporis TaxID=41062 RepID=A0A5N5XHX6_9EURO|nr:hypothetical protein BDV29DRAFT_166027 [Aspergillus leporis]
MLRRWSYACHAGRFLVDKRGRVECTGESDGLCQDGREGAVEVERQVEELRMMKRSAIDEFRELVTQWEEWVLGIVDHDGVEVTDENFEAKWDYLRRSRNELVEAWKASERKADMSKALRGLCHSSPDLWLSDSPDVEDEWEAERFAENENGGQDSSESISETS